MESMLEQTAKSQEAASGAGVRWEDVAGMEEAKRAVAMAVALARARAPAGVRITPQRRILFYGPPGTGKTLLAAATASLIRAGNRARAGFFSAKVGDLAGSADDESGRALSELWAKAREAAPSVLFLDEIDAIARRRGKNGVDGARERRVLSTLLVEMDGLAAKGVDEPFVLLIGATNRPWDLDRAVLQRFHHKILVGLPDEDARREIFDIHLTRRGHGIEPDLADLVRRTRDFSGRELERLCARAVEIMLADENPQFLELVVTEPEHLDRREIRTRPIRRGDFERALEGFEPQTSPEEAAKYIDWDPFKQGVY